MATDNFLDKKSVLGLAERVPMCPPPETIVFADSIQWGGGSFTGGNQYQSFHISKSEGFAYCSKI